MITALYVDDEQAMLDVAKAFLEQDGDISVETSISAMDALVRIETRHFDAIICDYQMPVVDGIQFLKTLRMQGRDIPFILFTGKGREDVAIEALNNGADFYLQKGGDAKAQFTELVNMLKRSIDQRAAAKRLKESEEIYEKLFKDNVEAMVLVEPKTGVIDDVNNAATSFFGYTREQMLEMNLLDIYPSLKKSDLADAWHFGAERGEKTIGLNRLANGDVREVEVFSGMLRVKGRTLGYAIIHDITDMRRSQRREERLNRVFKVMSISSQLILHAGSEIALIDGICKALVDRGGYLAAWAGNFENGAGPTHEVTRHQRTANDKRGRPSLLDEALLGNLGQRVLEQRDIVLERREIRIELQGGASHGLNVTYAALPLVIEGSLMGMMIIASDDLEAMEESEIGLLQELVDNLSEAIALFYQRERHASRLNEEARLGADLSEMIRKVPSGVMVLDPELRLIKLNPYALDILGRKEKEVLGESLLDLIPGARGSRLEETMLEVSRNRTIGTALLQADLEEPRWFKVLVLPTRKGIGLLFNDETEDMKGKASNAQDLNLLRQMIEASPTGIAVFDERGRITFTNQFAEEVLGVTREHIIGSTIDAPEWNASDIAGNPLAEGEQPVALALRTNQLVSGFRYAIEPRPGDRRFLSVNVTPLRDKEGGVLGAVATLQNITDSVMTEEALRKNELLLRELMGSRLDVVIKLDVQGIILYISPAVKNLIGLEPEAMTGKSVLEYVHPDDLDSLFQLIEETKNSKETKTVRLRLKHGEEDVVVEAIGRMTFDERGEPVSMVASLRDITSRQLAEDRLWDTGSKLRAIIQTSPMAIISIDANGLINTWNPAAERVFAWDNEESARPFPFLPAEDTEETRRIKSSIMAGEALSDVAVKRKTPNGQERSISISTAPILDQSGRVTSIIVVASDITERKAMEDRLLQLNDLLRLVNRILRHDTLNELMVLSGSLDMYQKTKQDRFLATATKAVNRSMEMIKRMKELESLAASGGALKVYDLRQTAENVLRGYMIEFSIEGEGSIIADDALASAIDNIVRNAVVHGKADKVEVKLWVDGGMCYLRIADNGVGIPDHVKRHIFEEGYSFGPNAGTGLGLYLVTRAVERYGGNVKVEDNQPKGTAFVLAFPKA